MAINLKTIEKLYGKYVLETLKDEYNYEQFEKNVIYLKNKKIESIEEIVERYYLIFFTEHQEFKEKVDNLIKRLGDNYIEILEENFSYWEEFIQ